MRFFLDCVGAVVNEHGDGSVPFAVLAVGKNVFASVFQKGFGVAVGLVVGFGVAVTLGVDVACGFGVEVGFGVAVGLLVGLGVDVTSGTTVVLGVDVACVTVSAGFDVGVAVAFDSSEDSAALSVSSMLSEVVSSVAKDSSSDRVSWVDFVSFSSSYSLRVSAISIGSLPSDCIVSMNSYSSESI